MYFLRKRKKAGWTRPLLFFYNFLFISSSSTSICLRPILVLTTVDIQTLYLRKASISSFNFIPWQDLSVLFKKRCFRELNGSKSDPKRSRTLLFGMSSFLLLADCVPCVPFYFFTNDAALHALLCYFHPFLQWLGGTLQIGGRGSPSDSVQRAGPAWAQSLAPGSCQASETGIFVQAKSPCQSRASVDAILPKCRNLAASWCSRLSSYALWLQFANGSSFFMQSIHLSSGLRPAQGKLRHHGSLRRRVPFAWGRRPLRRRDGGKWYVHCSPTTPLIARFNMV